MKDWIKSKNKTWENDRNGKMGKWNNEMMKIMKAWKSGKVEEWSWGTLKVADDEIMRKRENEKMESSEPLDPGQAGPG